MRLIFFITHLLVTLSNILVLIRIFLFQLLIVDHFWTYSCIEYTSFLYQLFSTDWLIYNLCSLPSWERGWHWEKLHAWENTSRQPPPPSLNSLITSHVNLFAFIHSWNLFLQHILFSFVGRIQEWNNRVYSLDLLSKYEWRISSKICRSLNLSIAICRWQYDRSKISAQWRTTQLHVKLFLTAVILYTKTSFFVQNLTQLAFRHAKLLIKVHLTSILLTSHS